RAEESRCPCGRISSAPDPDIHDMLPPRRRAYNDPFRHVTRPRWWAAPLMKTDSADPRKLAKATGLQYVTDEMPGIQRRRCGQGFLYLSPRGRRVTNR